MRFKKFISVSLIITIVCASLYIPRVSGKTLGDLESELKNKENELSSNKEQQKLTEDEMKGITSNLISIQATINQIQTDTKNIEADIVNLNNDIALKNEEIKRIMNYVQVSSGDSVYLDYMMGAQDFTDFIYRSAVSEQLAKYNTELIDSYNKAIETNNKRKVELANKRSELANKQVLLQSEYEKLGSRMSEYDDMEISITDEVKSLQELVKIYKDRGCTSDQDISTCGKAQLPSTTAFYRPLVSGYLTSWFGWRGCSDSRVSCYHSGLDFSTSNKNNTPVYAIGSGMVASLTFKSSCGGNMVFIHHKTRNGTTYTSVYMHLYKINVSKGDLVTKDTVIGIMGGGSTTPWDRCSTGAHTHLGIATGLYGIDYTSGSLKSHYVDPASIVNVPGSLYESFSDRLTAF